MHHQTLKAAVAKYGPLHTEGKTEEEVKVAIRSDEKAFSEEAVGEIYAGILAAAAPPAKDPTPHNEDSGNNPPPPPEKPLPNGKSRVYVVKSEFRDINDFSKVHQVGHDVSHFARERLEVLEAAGLVVQQ